MNQMLMQAKDLGNREVPNFLTDSQINIFIKWAKKKNTRILLGKTLVYPDGKVAIYFLGRWIFKMQQH